jgi:hypothetical protein
VARVGAHRYSIDSASFFSTRVANRRGSSTRSKVSSSLMSARPSAEPKERSRMPNWSGSSLAWRRDWISECSSGDREAHILAAVPPRALQRAAQRLGHRARAAAAPN